MILSSKFIFVANSGAFLICLQHTVANYENGQSALTRMSIMILTDSSSAIERDDVPFEAHTHALVVCVMSLLNKSHSAVIFGAIIVRLQHTLVSLNLNALHVP